MFITFLTDFGLEDDFVGTCHGVLKRIAPDTQIIDITHGIRPGHVLQAALMLANTLPYMPAGVHLAVVDPGAAEDRLWVEPVLRADIRNRSSESQPIRHTVFDAKRERARVGTTDVNAMPIRQDMTYELSSLEGERECGLAARANPGLPEQRDGSDQYPNECSSVNAPHARFR